MQLRRSYLRDPKILRALQYFEAVARHGSVKRAAEEFGVSASAVSHQLSDLSQYLGEEIVLREGRGIALTDMGRRIHVEMAAVLSSMDAVIGTVIGAKRSYLRIAVCSSFGPYWLAERLPDFHSRHPDIELELRLYSEDPLQTDAEADLIVTAGPSGIGFDSVPLFDEMLVAVRRPQVENGDALEKPRMITTDLNEDTFARDWREYLALSGRTRNDYHPGGWLRCTHYLLALSLAKAGLGVALVPDFLAASDLASGVLTQADHTVTPSGRSYRVCFKTSRAAEADLRAVANWMKGHASTPAILRQKRAGG